MSNAGLIEEEKSLLVPKPRRLVDPKAIEAARRKFCQVCGARADGLFPIDVHHLQSRGSGGPDSEENLVSLCRECHSKFHSGELTEKDIVHTWDEREPEDYEILVQRFVDIVEETDDVCWLQAAMFTVMIDGLKATPKQVAADTGWSAAKIRQFRQTFIAFPEEESRAKDMSFTHHRYAAMTDDPDGWLRRAVENQWSTRDLHRAIVLAELSEKAIEEAKQRRVSRLIREVREIVSWGDANTETLLGALAEILEETGRGA